MTAPLHIRSSNFFAYSNTLASIWRTSIWLPDQDSALANDPDVWEKLQEDIVIKQGIQSRLHKIAGRPTKLAPGRKKDERDELAVECVQQLCLDPIDNLPQARLNLAKGVFLGRTYGYIDGERRPCEFNGKVLDWWVPFHIEDIQRERVRFVPRHDEMGQPLAPVVEIADLAVGAWTRQSADTWSNYIEYLYDNDERRLGMGRGSLAAIYLASYIRTMLLKHGLQGVEKLAQGLAIAKMDLDRASSTDKTNDQRKIAFLNSINAQRDAANAIVIEKDDELEYVFPSGTGGDLVLKLLEYNDACLTRYLTCALLPSGGGSDVGSNARAETEQEEAADVLQYESNLLDDTISRHLIGQFWRMNRPNLIACGLGTAHRPKLMPHREVKPNPKERAEVAQIASQFLDLKKDELYEQLGFTMPTQEDIDAGNIVESKPAPDPMMGAFGQGFDENGGDRPENSGNPNLDRARGMARAGLERMGREKLNGTE